MVGVLLQVVVKNGGQCRRLLEAVYEYCQAATLRGHCSAAGTNLEVSGLELRRQLVDGSLLPRTRMESTRQAGPMADPGQDRPASGSFHVCSAKERHPPWPIKLCI